MDGMAHFHGSVRGVNAVSFSLALVSAILWGLTSLIKPSEFYIPPDFVLSSYPNLSSTVPMVPLDIAAFGMIIIVVVALKALPELQRQPFAAFSTVMLNAFVVCTVGTITNLLKFFVGRPRPNMYAICGQNASLSTCESVPRFRRYDTFASWPSGHASISMSATCYLVSFMKRAVRPSVSVLIFVLLVFFAAFWVGGTRIKDYKHHPDDVVCGFLLGFVGEWVMWPFCKALVFTQFTRV